MPVLLFAPILLVVGVLFKKTTVVMLMKPSIHKDMAYLEKRGTLSMQDGLCFYPNVIIQNILLTTIGVKRDIRFASNGEITIKSFTIGCIHNVS